MTSRPTPRFTPDDLVEVYAERRRIAEFFRRCLPITLAAKSGVARWNRMVRFSVLVPKTTTPQPEGQGVEGQEEA